MWAHFSIGTNISLGRRKEGRARGFFLERIDQMRSDENGIDFS